MAQRTRLAAVLNGLVRNVDLTADELVVNSVRYGGLAGTELTKTILDSLIANSHAAMSDNQNIVAGDGLTGGGSGATVTLNVGAGSGITVNANDIEVNNTVIRTNGANAFSANQSMGGFKLTNLATPTSGTDAANKAYVDSAAGTLGEWQNSALDYIVNNTLAPPTEVLGDRYILSHDGGVPHANYDGASAGDIVEFNGSVWVATTPSIGFFISSDNDADRLYYWGGTAWEEKFFENTTASTGLTKVGSDIRLDASSAGAGLGFSSGVLSANVDNSTIEINSDTLRVKDLGITTAKLADDSVDKDKINANVAGNGLGQNVDGSLEVKVSASGAIIISSDALQINLEASNPSLQISSNELGLKFDPAGALSKVAAGVKVNVDDSSIEIASNALRVKAAGITNAMLAGSIEDSKLNQITTANKVAGSAVQLNSNASISNDSGLKANHVPMIKIPGIAGEAFAANTTFAVRFAKDGETAGRLYKADFDASTDDNFYVIGVIQPSSALSAGDPIDYIIQGEVALLANDSVFAAAEIGEPVHLLASGAFDALAAITYTANKASVKFAMVKTTSSMLIQSMQFYGIN